MKKDPVLSIIIPCFNAKKYIEKCLDSILRSTFKDFEIIVIDDGSTDGSRKYLEKKYSNIGYRANNGERSIPLKVIFLPKNVGPAQARNIGAKKARGKYLFFLDIDTEIKGNCFKIIVSAFKEKSKTAAFQAKLIKGKSDRIETAGHFLSFFGFPYEIGVGESENQHNQEKEIFGARSAGMAVRKNVFKKINGFDEDYFIYGEETDLCWRVWLAGHKIIYLPQAKVFHFQKSSLNEKTKHRIFYQGAKNNTSNILKNAPLSMLIWILPFHLLAWLVLALKLIFQLRFSAAVSIAKGLVWNLLNLNKTLKKRKNPQFVKIILGNANPKTLLIKGWQWFKNV